MARIILNCITHHLLDDVVSESQCAFRRNRGKIDMILAVRQIKEKCREQNQNLYILFVHLTKAFDTVGRDREGLWAILLKLSSPLRVLKIIRSFHDGMMTCIVENGLIPDPFPDSNRVKKRCLYRCLISNQGIRLCLENVLFGIMTKNAAQSQHAMHWGTQASRLAGF